MQRSETHVRDLCVCECAGDYGDDYRGEEAFYNMQYMYGWAQLPMLPRLGETLDRRIPISVILGQRSWMKSVTDGRCVGEAISELRPQSYVAVHHVGGAGHHVHADQPQVFCDLVNNICSMADAGNDQQPAKITTGKGERERHTH